VEYVSSASDRAAEGPHPFGWPHVRPLRSRWPRGDFAPCGGSSLYRQLVAVTLNFAAASSTAAASAAASIVPGQTAVVAIFYMGPVWLRQFGLHRRVKYISVEGPAQLGSLYIPIVRISWVRKVPPPHGDLRAPHDKGIISSTYSSAASASPRSYARRKTIRAEGSRRPRWKHAHAQSCGLFAAVPQRSYGRRGNRPCFLRHLWRVFKLGAGHSRLFQNCSGRQEIKIAMQ
jgi:hypothetical protein